jgi:hypothetical protein
MFNVVILFPTVSEGIFALKQPKNKHDGYPLSGANW